MKMAKVDFKDTLKKCMKDDEFKAEFDRLTPEYQLKSALIATRCAKKLMQSQVAKLSGLKQSNISRLENLQSGVSLSTIISYARAVRLKELTIRL